MSMLGITVDHSAEQKSAIGVRINERSLRQRDTSINYTMDNDGHVLRGVKRRSISRPTKHTPGAQRPNETDDIKSIEKFYMKKSLGRLKNTDLETIFEDVVDDVIDDATGVDGSKVKSSATTFGLRKLKRRLTFSTTKALREKRKKRALSILGGGKRFKKVSMQYFVEHLNALNALHSTENNVPADVASADDGLANSIASNSEQ